MDSDRGGALYGLLAAIGFIVVVMAVIFAVCIGSAGAQQVHRGLGRVELVSYDRCRHDDCGDRYGDGGSGGGQGASGGDYEGGKSGDNDQRGDHNCRNFCFYGIPQPGQGGGDQPAPKDQQPRSVACAIPIPWHCDPAPHGFIPPDPRKIPQQVADFVKLVADFAQGVVHFAV